MCVNYLHFDKLNVTTIFIIEVNRNVNIVLSLLKE